VKRALIATISIVASLLTGCHTRSLQDERDAALAADIRGFASSLSAKDEFSGVVFLSRNGSALVRSGFGLANRETKRSNTPETPFMLSSVAKMFTAVTIARLVERRQVSFESRLSSILPEYPNPDVRERVTVRHLLTMSSGIPDLFSASRFWAEIGTIKSSRDMWKYFTDAPLQFAPGTQWAYSNSNYLLLGEIIERIAGRQFHAVVEQEVFRPLGMTSTSYRVDLPLSPALGYTRMQGDTHGPRWTPAWSEPQAGSEFMAGNAMGGGYSTVDDLARFAEALMAYRILTRQTTADMLTGSIDADYGGRDGLGFETRMANGVRSAGHRGSLAGSSTQVEFYPDLGYVLIVLGNTDSSGTQDIASHLRSRLTSSNGK
jgi:CubicO group peptidase (beta-lactamase class C family)